MLTQVIFLTTLALPAAVSGGAPPAAPDVARYDGVLREYVLDNGAVRYGALRANLEPLDRFVEQIGSVSPDSHPGLFPTREAKLAYWINAYNALVLWAFARDYPEEKDRLDGLIGRGLFFYQRKFLVGGKKLSLATLENDIIRERFHEPRIHFAIVCASASCPWLARRAYTADNLDELLEARTRLFVNQDRNVKIDPPTRTVTLSKIFDWYDEDFGATDGQILKFIARYRKDGTRLLHGEWRVRHFAYDWSPNDAPDSTR